MSSGFVLVLFLLLLLVAVAKFAWSRSVARNEPSRGDVDVNENDWDAVQQRGHSHDGGWGSSHYFDSSHGHSSHTDSSDSDGGGGDSSSD